MEEFKAWYKTLPIVSRTFISIIVLVTIISSIIYKQFPIYILLNFQKLMGLQIWRIFTNFFFIGVFGPNIIWEFVFLYFSVTRVENLFTERQVDEQLWLYITNMLFLSIIGIIFGEAFMLDSLLFAFVYIWCKRKPFETVQFFFGLKFRIIKKKAHFKNQLAQTRLKNIKIMLCGYFPFILIGLHTVMGGSIYTDLYGLAAGHLYIFLKDIYAVSSGKNYLRTPQFFTRLVQKYITSNIQAHNYQNPNNNIGAGNRQFQGQGVRLG